MDLKSWDDKHNLQSLVTSNPEKLHMSSAKRLARNKTRK